MKKLSITSEEKKIILEMHKNAIIKEQNSLFYTVKPGENLYRVSKKFNIDVDTLAKLNNIGDVTKVNAGQRIKIPNNTVTDTTTNKPYVPNTKSLDSPDDYTTITKGSYPKVVNSYDELIKTNKKFFGLDSSNSKITPEYKNKVNQELDKRNVPEDERSLFGVVKNSIPYWETAIDINQIFSGLISQDKEKFYSGILGLAAPLAGQLFIDGVDYIGEKLVGKKGADEMAEKRNEIINMSERDLIELYKRYGYGGYDKWVQDGKPKLH